jgi:hypothetical protein
MIPDGTSLTSPFFSGSLRQVLIPSAQVEPGREKKHFQKPPEKTVADEINSSGKRRQAQCGSSENAPFKW